MENPLIISTSDPRDFQAPNIDEPSGTVELSNGRDKAVGLSALGLCIAAYTFQSVILKQISTESKDTFGPFFTLWLSHSTFMLLIPASLVQVWSGGSGASQRKFRHWSHYVNLINRLSGREWKSFMKISFSLALLYTFPNYLWYIVLRLTSISEATTIFSTNCVFAYLLPAFIKGAPLKIISVIALILSLMGTALISIETVSNISLENSRFLGNVVTLVSAFSYSLYEVLYEKYASGKHSSTFLANQYTGWIGVFTFATQWIFVPILHILNIEKFKFIYSFNAWKLVILNACLSFAYNSLFMLSLALIGPTVSSVGLMLAIPASWLVEYLIDVNFKLSLFSAIGSVFIIVGFVLLVKNEMSNPQSAHSDDDDE